MKGIIIYWTGTGHTEEMANEIASGIKSAGGEVDVFTCAEFSGDIAGYDKVLLGCPSMGAEQLEDGEFEPMYESLKSALAGKIVGLFGPYGWGDGEWMRTWTEDATAAGISVFGGEGLAVQEDESDMVSICNEFGKKNAE